MVAAMNSAGAVMPKYLWLRSPLSLQSGAFHLFPLCFHINSTEP